MQLIRGLRSLHSPAHQARFAEGCVATIGNFDGVHLGHQAVLDQVQRKADALGLPAVIMLFEPQPREYFAPQQAPARITTLREKLELLRGFGVHCVLCVRFNDAFCSQSAAQFCQDILVRGLNVKHLVIGDDFRFGSDRAGDFAFLQRFGQQHGFTVEDTPTLSLAGERVSSTAIRQCLQQGDFAAANHLLGWDFALSGPVVYGDQIGRTINVPTANILLHRLASPLQGVFAVDVYGADNDIENSAVNGVVNGVANGVANIGKRPTVNGQQLRLEIHLLDFKGDLYGQRLRAVFRQKIRDEKRFASLDELKQNIQRDIEQARHIFAQ